MPYYVPEYARKLSTARQNQFERRGGKPITDFTPGRSILWLHKENGGYITCYATIAQAPKNGRISIHPFGAVSEKRSVTLEAVFVDYGCDDRDAASIIQAAKESINPNELIWRDNCSDGTGLYIHATGVVLREKLDRVIGYLKGSK